VRSGNEARNADIDADTSGGEANEVFAIHLVRPAVRIGGRSRVRA
jgi:hypothetical protein